MLPLPFSYTCLFRTRTFSPPVWSLQEQVLIASLDVGDVDTARKSYSKLVARFPDSNRVKRVDGMFLEFNGEFEEALKLYDDVLQSSPSNFLVRKRKVCVHKAKGDLKAAITELNDLLEICAADIPSWSELSEIYISLCDYQVNAFFFER